jgi:hypothetical protein
MNNRKLFIEITYLLGSLIIIASVGLDIHQYKKIKKLTQKIVARKIINDESNRVPDSDTMKMDRESNMKKTPEFDNIKTSTVKVDVLKNYSAPA